ncbi:MAG: hypothetical protein CM15mP33_00820 [Candidatus Neomarinimicrobiota bacterium]|nr:MAG: hypothetical protein CM15mP33_00820 [Candidatus Neomarinimicrobiota bacterium]
MVDDCHATGFIGTNGKGSGEHCGVLDEVDIISSTFGKALGGAREDLSLHQKYCRYA